MSRTLRILVAAAALGAAGLCASEASAKGGFGGGFGGFGHHHHHGHWGHGPWGRGFGWGGPRLVGFVSAYYGACRVRRYIDEDGDLIVRRACY
ncbi:hypothetical protein [Methylobacterium nigriterrae]|uniref:hypothetical protein n=1 Tax=Methylobacterium nigriterrae TaxID=3127512 RepID=UPI0030139742